MDIFWVLPNGKSNYEKISKWISLKIYEEGRDLNLYSWFESKVNSAMYFYKINNFNNGDRQRNDFFQPL